ncbi:MAG: biotin/lipoyl-containing protein, partial [Glaciecola sp.]
VTPTSQIVGPPALINVLTGERYKSITKETAGVLKGEYGATAAPVNAELQAKVLGDDKPITCRPADILEPELANLEAELDELVAAEDATLAEQKVDDVLTYALFPQVGFKFIKNRNNPDAFEPAPVAPVETPAGTVQSATGEEHYSVRVNGTDYAVTVAPDGQLTDAKAVNVTAIDAGGNAGVASTASPSGISETINAPLAGNIFKLLVRVGDQVNDGDVVMIMEAMKMETEVRSLHTGIVNSVDVSEGDAVQAGQAIITLG